MMGGGLHPAAAAWGGRRQRFHMPLSLKLAQRNGEAVDCGGKPTAGFFTSTAPSLPGTVSEVRELVQEVFVCLH